MLKHSATSTLLMCGFRPPVNYLCWVFFCFSSGSCWQSLQTAMYILNRQSTLLPAGQPRYSRLTHVVDQVLHRKSCLSDTGRGWKIFEEPQRTHLLTPTYFFHSRKENIKSIILYVKHFFFFLFLASLAWNNFYSGVRH